LKRELEKRREEKNGKEKLLFEKNEQKRKSCG
jgi:hypothetical protein